jgi:large subunit ribosomal protein L18
MGKDNIARRFRRKRSIRKSVKGTPERPRLTVFRSSKHIYGQVIDDTRGKTLVACSSLSKDLAKEMEGLEKKEMAAKVGEALAKKCVAEGVEKVVFDRNGYLYHGRVAALATGARKGGLRF